MRYLASHEQAVRGTFDFPIALYQVDSTHPRYKMPFHWHMEHELIAVLDGVFHLSVEGQHIDLHRGDCMMIGEDTIHGGLPEHCVYVCVVFDLDRFLTGMGGICRQQLNGLLADGSKLQAVFSAGSPPALLVNGLYQAMATEQPGYEFTTMGYLWQLLGQMISHRLYRPPLPGTGQDMRRTQAIKRVLRRIRTDYAMPLTLEDLAYEAALEPKYFCRVFRQITGRTPIDYLLYYRIECAAELLCATRCSVTEVALSCGFGDVSYFGRVFKRQKAMTPRAYRASFAQSIWTSNAASEEKDLQ